jgi:hypothetical protein
LLDCFLRNHVVNVERSARLPSLHIMAGRKRNILRVKDTKIVYPNPSTMHTPLRGHRQKSPLACAQSKGPPSERGLCFEQRQFLNPKVLLLDGSDTLRLGF